MDVINVKKSGSDCGGNRAIRRAKETKECKSEQADRTTPARDKGTKKEGFLEEIFPPQKAGQEAVASTTSSYKLLHLSEKRVQCQS